MGDLIVYRNLVPVDQRLAPLASIAAELGLPQNRIPRKCEPAYGRVISCLLQQARALEAPGTPIERLIYIGDTRMNDGIAFSLICQARGWPGVAFIGAEQAGPARVELVNQQGRTLYLANRWSALADFERYCRGRGFIIDENTAVVIDLDKTVLGARGRNDHVIDRARLDAVRCTLSELLGAGFDEDAFQRAYDHLNRPEFHPFTADNQDYLAYICLILGTDVVKLEDLIAAIHAGRLSTFERFIAKIDRRVLSLPPDLQALHHQVYRALSEGDPTPFKAFRRNEYLATVTRMGQLNDNTPVKALLAGEIVITQEVQEVAKRWQEQGALLFGLSDKPNEASIPDENMTAQGYQPIHRTVTHAVGG